MQESVDRTTVRHLVCAQVLVVHYVTDVTVEAGPWSLEAAYHYSYVDVYVDVYVYVYVSVNVYVPGSSMSMFVFMSLFMSTRAQSVL